MSPTRKTAVSIILLLLLVTHLSGSPETPAIQDEGTLLFANYCSACHQVDGSGTEDGPPPLANSPWIKGPKRHLIRIVLDGLHGPIIVNEKLYDLEMPSFGPILSDAQIASILTYARQAFAEPHDDPITAQDVAIYRTASATREGYWTAPELRDAPELP